MRNRNRSDNNSSEQASRSPHLLRLDVSKAAPPPSFFRCPISLEVMLSPVSLCTGVTYDRSSIQRWLDSGNTTCPATMQSLSSTELVPNLTLRRLIHLWSSSCTSSSHQYIPSSLSELARMLSDPTADEAYKLRLLSSDALRPSALASLFLAPETLDLAVTLASLLLSLDLVDVERKRALIAALLSDLDATVTGLVAVFKGAEYSSSRVAAARVLEMLIAEERTVMAGKPVLATELVRLIGEADGEAVDAGLRCLTGLTGAGRRVRAEMVRMGVIPALTNVMERDEVEIPAAAVENAMRVMVAAVGIGEGRAAFCAEAERNVAAVVGRMIKVGNEGREAAVGLLWRVCCCGGGDRRARKAAAVAKGGLGKILVVMQGDCSPLVRRMAVDLLRVFRATSKGSMAAAGYDSMTIHITPY
ncbi:hypothetical protein IEQ34_000250 [Dendrobium chrysotoxum]|uniref:U-box domain-containing protein n=1 Tax=Dendrobium chrysotoxum TaxID=161865 RepID=A0AAV7HQ02_DENCH|nr:hypothetical protein IEQ34_000250 [Dendrobium chrysotoxum]